MKKVSAMLLCLGVLAGLANTVNAEEVNAYQSNGTVKFRPNTDPTNPVNPLDPDPEKPVKPIDPVDPNGPGPGTNGPLSIDFASSLDFGVNKISNKDEVYYARAQTYLNENGEVDSLITPNYVQVSDNRGTNVGWTLKVKQNSQFKNETTKHQELKGAQITLTNPFVDSVILDVDAPTANESIELDPLGAIEVVMSAKQEAGAGTWINGWGNVESATEVNEENTEVPVNITKDIALSIPGTTPKDAVKYTTTLTWLLEDIPAN